MIRPPSLRSVGQSYALFVGRKSILSHEREDRLSKLHAQKHRAAAATVRKRNSGSVARCAPSARTRQICARVIKPKTVPVVMRYAFIRIVSRLLDHNSQLECPPSAKVGDRSQPRPKFGLTRQRNGWPRQPTDECLEACAQAMWSNSIICRNRDSGESGTADRFLLCIRGPFPGSWRA